MALQSASTFKDGPVRPGRSSNGESPNCRGRCLVPMVMSAEEVSRSLRRLSHEIVEAHTAVASVVLVGIHTRGVYLARQLAANIKGIAFREVAVGELDVGLYRDDREMRDPVEPRPTVVPDISGANLVVVDDVLFTGRTVRAALDALVDLGRAETTELAVLVDRGHRELPIRADYVGKNLPTSRDEVVRVKLEEVDGESGVWIESVVAA